MKAEQQCECGRHGSREFQPAPDRKIDAKPETIPDRARNHEKQKCPTQSVIFHETSAAYLIVLIYATIAESSSGVNVY